MNTENSQNTEINTETPIVDINPAFTANKWQPGKSGNPKGRPKGRRNYATIMQDAFEKIGQSKGMTADEVESMLLQSGITHAMLGDYDFYSDIVSRLHGPLPKTPEASPGDTNILNIGIISQQPIDAPDAFEGLLDKIDETDGD